MVIKILSIAIIFGQIFAAPGPDSIAPSPASDLATTSSSLSPIPPIAGAMKQMKFAFTTIGTNSKTAQKECQTELDKIKMKCIGSSDPCCVEAVNKSTLIESAFKTAFEPCKMKKDIMQIRLASMAVKKLDKKKKKTKKSEITTDATIALTAVPVPLTLAEINTMAELCASDTKDDQLALIQAVDEELEECQSATL